VRLLFDITTPETHDLTCTCCTTILALQTLTLLMTPTTRFASASISMELLRQIQRMRQPLEEGTRRLRSSFLLHGMRLNSLWTRECNSSKSANCRTGSTRNEKICAYFNKPSSMSARHAHMAEELERARDVNRRIVEDRAVEPPVFGRASQNVVAAAMLLRNMSEPSNPEARRARDEIRGLLETTAMQQPESSASRRRGLASE
jgi:hypothetical protein